VKPSDQVEIKDLRSQKAVPPERKSLVIARAAEKNARTVFALTCCHESNAEHRKEELRKLKSL
jgi:hypothetical protein